MENNIDTKYFKFTIVHLIYAFIIGFSLAYILLSIPSVLKHTGAYQKLHEQEVQNLNNENKECKFRVECIS